MSNADGPAAAADAKPRLSRRRLWLFRAVAGAFPFLLIVFANWLLYCFDIGHNTELVVTAQTESGKVVHYLNPDVGAAYCGVMLAGPEPRPFVLPKPQGLYRIVVVGESTARGYPYPSELAFPRQMEFLLERQLASDSVEVLNAATVGISTPHVVDLVRQSQTCEPDLMVVYVGHNEFYGVGGIASAYPLGSDWSLYLRHFRLMQVLGNVTSPKIDPSRPLIAALPRDLEIELNGPTFRDAALTYRRNLERIAAMCIDRQTPLVLCGVAGNLRDQSPLGSLSRPGRSPGDIQRRDELIARAATLRDDGQFETALAACEEAEQLDDASALIVYRRAQCLEALGRRPQAAEAYLRAQDLDGCRLRAPSAFKTIAHDVAAAHRDQQVYFVDLAESFAEASQYAAPGNDLFLEHVHFTLAGHRLAAQEIARCIVEQVHKRTWDDARTPSLPEQDAWLGFVPEDNLTARILISTILQNPPLSNAADAERHLAFAKSQIQEQTQRIPQDELELFSRMDYPTMVERGVEGLAVEYVKQREFGKALPLLELAKRRRGWYAHTYILAALCLTELGRRQQAVRNLQDSFDAAFPPTEQVGELRQQLLEELSY